MNANFKAIPVVNPVSDLIDIVLSKTQRKTPTIVHPQYEIGRIRSFYMRKVKFTQGSFSEKLLAITQSFPSITELHPFYSDLVNVLYDKDHYKLALGHVNAVKNIIDSISKDYLKLMKHGDSLYRLKMLKKAALGRMCTAIKKLSSSLSFLEEVRKHMMRMPNINVYDKTMILTGFPNVGKSSFINNLTNANVDVQPYPFTTQSIFVGHTDYKYQRFQILDTPGILDHELESRNTIEMQAITALAHLKACILFFIDISETCGYSIEKQIALFNSIQPLFKEKPCIVILSKLDIISFQSLPKVHQEIIQSLNLPTFEASNFTGLGLADIKAKACELLIEFRAKNKITQQIDKSENKAYVSLPKKRDNKKREPCIPNTVLNKENNGIVRKTLKDFQEEMGGAGVFNFPLQEHFKLQKDEWKYDIVPEIMDGKNIADFVDEDILAKLDKLEKEEELLLKFDQGFDMEINPEYKKAHTQIKEKKALLRLKHRLTRNQRRISVPQKNLKSKRSNKTMQDKQDDMELESSQIEPRIAARITKKITKKWDRAGIANETDRRITASKPRHLFSGKRGKGKTDRR